MAYRKWRPGKTKAREYAKTMQEIDDFCFENGISKSRTSDSYYFILNGVEYRVSNHTIASSNQRAYDEFGNKLREKYHPDKEKEDVIYITAGKTRIKEIYTNLKNGKRLNRRGYVID